MVVNLRGSEGRAPAAGFSGDSVSLTSISPINGSLLLPRGAAISCRPSAAHCGVLLQDPLFWTGPLSHWCLCGSFWTLFLRSRGWASTSCVGLRGTVQHIPTLISRPPGQNHIQTHPWVSTPIPTCRLHRPMPHPSQFVCLTLTHTHVDSHIHFYTYFEFPSSG